MTESFPFAESSADFLLCMDMTWEGAETDLPSLCCFFFLFFLRPPLPLPDPRFLASDEALSIGSSGSESLLLSELVLEQGRREQLRKRRKHCQEINSNSEAS